MAVNRDVYTVGGYSLGEPRRCLSDRRRRIYAQSRDLTGNPSASGCPLAFQRRWADRTGKRPHSKKPVRSAIAAPLNA